ncbi:MAG: hypothetical protein H7145_18855 [Akkermansiaceae bacterium]|nr:hypothetical protein [Armatimonadota bacterium]
MDTSIVRSRTLPPVELKSPTNRKFSSDTSPTRARYLTFEDFMRRDFGERHVEWVGGKVIEM